MSKWINEWWVDGEMVGWMKVSIKLGGCWQAGCWLAG